VNSTNLIFDSRDEHYKTPFGAVKNCQTVKYAVCWFKKSSVFLNIYHEEKKTTETVRMHKLSGSRWEAEYVFTEPGLYFYHFEADGEYILKASSGSTGYISGEFSENRFVQLVYANEYIPPSNLNGKTIYQIFPDRFFRSSVIKTEFTERIIHIDTDTQPISLPENGIVKNNDFFGGNLKGIIKKLPYLSQLGVGIIYLNPIFESHSNHRYDTADYMKIDPLLGTNDDFKVLCNKADELGIVIILDGVFSHTGADSIYFDKYHRYGGNGAYKNEDSPFRDWYIFNNSKIGYECWWGFPTLPNTDKNNPKFREYICGADGVIEHWMSLGAGGFRLDVADELSDNFIEEIRKAVKRHGSDKILIGEVWEDASVKISYGRRRRYLLGYELDSVMNYPFREAILDFMREADAALFIDRIMEIIENYPKPMMDVMMNLLSTHDTERLINALVAPVDKVSRKKRINLIISREDYLKGIELAKMAFTLLFTLPGLPSIYYGDEIGMIGSADPFNRGYFKWNDPDVNILNFVTELSFKRRSCSAFKDGIFIPVYHKDSCIAYLRKNLNSCVLIVANRSESVKEIFFNDKIYMVAPWRTIIEQV